MRALTLLLLVSGLLSGCSTSSENGSDADQPLVQSEYKLKQDREAFEELRKEVPPNVKEENDELAFLEQLFLNPLKNPSEIRDQFNKALRKKREALSKDLQRSRETFVKIERKERDSFSRKAKDKREQFKSQKLDREKTKEFYDELDLERKDFNAAQKDKRDLFESQMKDARKNFDDYSKVKQTDFNARLKVFQEKQKEILNSQKK